MKRNGKITLVLSSLLLISGLMQGCSSNAPVAKEKESTPAWKVISEAAITHNTNYAGFLDETLGITVGYAGEVHYTNDGGKTWPQATNKSLCRFGLDILNKNTAWHCGNGGQVRVTADGGKTWQEVSNFGNSEPSHCRFLSFINDQTGWIASPGRLASTADGAKTWVEMTLPEGAVEISAIFLRTSKDGYLLDSAGILFMTNDGGKTWSRNDLGLQALNLNNGKIQRLSTASAVMSFTDSNNGVIVFNAADKDGWKTWSMDTSDGGKIWKQEVVQIGESYKQVSLYLSHDGKYLSAYGFPGKIAILKR